jgi:two-component system, OmpR family, phosphate regulon response regulator PhoB
MKKILVVEDSSEAFHLVQVALGQLYEIHLVKNLREAYCLVAENAFDLVLLDLKLPDGDGFTFCSMLKSSDLLADLPIIFLSSSFAIADQVMGFSVGADDYMAKPFHPEELRSRVKVKLHRRELERERLSKLIAGNIELNTLFSRAWVHRGEEVIEVFFTSIEFRLIRYLMSRANQVVTRKDIFRYVWGDDVHVYDRSADTHISKIRKKLGDLAADTIESVHGSGYRFVSATSSRPSSLENYRKSLPRLTQETLRTH